MTGSYQVFAETQIVAVHYALQCGRCWLKLSGTVDSEADVPFDGWRAVGDGPNGGGHVLCPGCCEATGKRAGVWDE